jgi:indole-3-glycerol phosphate synthase
LKNFLKILFENSQKAINGGIYETSESLEKSKYDIINEIKKNPHASLITEIKFASPSQGKIREKQNPVEIANSMVNGGAKALSVLTQPYFFEGSPEYFIEIRKKVKIPMLMKDIVIDKSQIDAAKKIGADLTLLIQSFFENGYLKEVDEFVDYSHKNNLKVILEAHTKSEFENAIKTDADLIGINNRNLNTLELDINTTKRILEKKPKAKVIVSESGIQTPEHIRFLKKCGADAFLIGTSIMKSANIEEEVRKLVNAI